jgi:hypothetical protein
VETEYADDLIYLYESLIKNLFFEIIFDCMVRLREGILEECEGIHKCLSIIESFIEIKP